MRIAGNAGSEDRKKFFAVCGFVIVAAVYLYFQFWDSGTPAVTPPPPVVVSAPVGGVAGRPAGSNVAGREAKTVAITAAALDPTLHMDAMLVTESVAYGGNGRNIFSAMSAPVVVIPRPIAPARPLVAVQAPPPPPMGPPPPPPIDMKFCGYFEDPATGKKQAILSHGEDVVLAAEGEIVLRRYRVITIAARSILVEDMPNNNRQTLPLLAN